MSISAFSTHDPVFRFEDLSNLVSLQSSDRCGGRSLRTRDTEQQQGVYINESHFNIGKYNRVLKKT